MKREEFIATVGYSGDVAIVDGKARKKLGTLSVSELLELGLFRSAFCAAIFDDDARGRELVLDRYNASEGTRYRRADELKRVFGVDSVPEGVTRVKVL